jgi:hypothetical protein
MPRIITPSSVSRWTADLRQPVLPDDPAVRATGAIVLFTVGIVHALGIQGQVSGAVWLTTGFCLLTVVGPVSGLWLLVRPSSAAWQFGALTCLADFAGYVLTRSVPVPGDAGDAGNWLEPLGVVTLITEAVFVILAMLVLASIRRPGRRGAAEGHPEPRASMAGAAGAGEIPAR